MWQFTINAAGRGRMFGADVCETLRRLGQVLGSRCLLFSLVDDHGHWAVSGSRREASRLAGNAGRVMRGRSPLPLEPARITPINGRRHLLELVAYFARQPVKHGLPDHPAGWSGSCVADLVGVRRTPGFTRDALWSQLPRLTVDAVLRTVEMDRGALQPANHDTVRALGPARVLDSAAAALCVVPTGRSELAVTARAACARLLEDAGCARREIAFGLDVPARTARWLCRREVDATTLALVRRRVTWDGAVRAAPPVAPSPREHAALASSAFR